MKPPAPGTENCIWFRYRFTSPQDRVREVLVRLDPDTLGLIAEERAGYPEWTRLTHHQCANCPLRPADHPRCPVAANLVEVIECFKDSVSCEPTEVEIATESRTCQKRAPLQDGLSALVGIYMVTSGCPILDKLRPMVQSHLPFATREETTYRAIAMYWLAQFFRRQRGLAPDWELAGLARIYEEIITVNRSFRLRIADDQLADAGLNALFRLDCYAQITNRLLLRKNLGEIERLFRGYLGGGPTGPATR
jgi:hypothetical protein